jgi:ribosomal-protein-alanine N-acetyltransferase
VTQEIKELGIGDLESILPIMSSAFDPNFREAWTKEQVIAALLIPGTVLISINSRSVPVGFALIRTLFETCELLLIAVSPESRGESFGKRLLLAAIHKAKDSGAETLFLEVRVTNDAISFYKRHNFKVIGERINYYRNMCGESLNALTMSIDIT